MAANSTAAYARRSARRVQYKMTREHNDANVLPGARVVDYDTAERLTDIFLSTGYISGTTTQGSKCWGN